MKRLILALVMLALAIGAGCSKSSSPSGPSGTPAIRIVVAHPGAAPSMTDPNGTAWDTVTTRVIRIQDTTPVKTASVLGVNGLADSVKVQAIRVNDTLYLRVRWHDVSHDIWPSRIDVIACQGNPLNTCFSSQDGGIFEDRALVLFGGLTGQQWDVLDWRALTTGAGNLAMGGIFRRDTLAGIPFDTIVADAEPSALVVASPNYDANTFGTLFMRTDSNLFNGPILYSTEIVNFRALGVPWAVGQHIPGFYIDSSLVNKDVITRGSRWDTKAISTWDTTSATYTLVLARPMNTGYIDDANLIVVDSIATQIALFDNQGDFSRGSKRGFTTPFWLILQ
jgi:hypothetical protein